MFYVFKFYANFVVYPQIYSCDLYVKTRAYTNSDNKRFTFRHANRVIYEPAKYRLVSMLELWMRQVSLPRHQVLLSFAVIYSRAHWSTSAEVIIFVYAILGLPPSAQHIDGLKNVTRKGMCKTYFRFYFIKLLLFSTNFIK